MRNIAIIPARGGSKRLPRKNILPLGGRPLLTRVIECCLLSGVFSKIIVSTEDAEIAEVAKGAGADVHMRSELLAQDRSTVVEVCKDVLQTEECVDFCCVYATSGLLTPKTIRDSGMIFFNDKAAHTLIGVSSFNYSPVQALKVDDDDYAEMLLPEYMKVQSQFHPKTRVSNGTFCWARRELFLMEGTFYSSKLRVFDVPDNEVCDLDTPEDYERLLTMFKVSE